MRRVTLPLACAALLAALLVAPASAAPKTGCPNGQGFGEWTVSAAADRIWPILLDQSAFPGGIADLEAALEGYDRNAEGSICLKFMWGEDLNPNSHWYLVGVEILGSPTEQVFVFDNNSGA